MNVEQTLEYVVLAAIAWIALGTMNYAWYNRYFRIYDQVVQQRDLLVLLGPVGSVMLGLMTLVGGFLALCGFLGEHLASKR